MNGRRIAALIGKETRELVRDPITMWLALLMPLVMLFLFGYAVTLDVEGVRVGILDESRSPSSRELAARFAATENFAVPRTFDSMHAVGDALERAEVQLAIVIPPDFERRLLMGPEASVQILVDGTYSAIAAIAAGYAAAIVRGFPAPHHTGVEVDTRVWYNPDQETARFMVLSMIALASMLVGAICPAASIVRERERGTIEQLLVTPIRIGEMFAAKALPTLLINLLGIAPALVVTRIFDVPLRGSLATFVALIAVFQLSAIAFGVFIASLTRTLQQALLLAFFGSFPILFLSGTMTPIESMPPLLQAASYLSPVRYFMEIVLGVFLKGAGWAQLWPQVATLALIGAALFGLSLLVFRRRLA